MRDPIPEIFQAAETLSLALQAHLDGAADETTALIHQADLPAIAAWTDSIWGIKNPKIHRFKLLPDSPPRLPIADRPVPRMPTRDQKIAVIERDGYHCRFCGIPVISSETRAKVRSLYPQALRWGARNAEQHAAFQCMWLQFDHVLPNQRGGTSDPENIVITCAPCNFGRMEWTIEEAGLADPRERIFAQSWSGFSTWRGLTGF